MASNGSQERLVRINGRIKRTEVGNHDILECKKQAQRLVNSENPPRFDNGRKKGYMGIMKQLWEEKGYGYLELTEQNLRDQAAKLEKTLGNVRQRISENIRTRECERNEEPVEGFQNANTGDQDLHMEESEAVPDERPSLSSEARELLKSATNVYIHIHPCEGDFSNRTIDTRTKGTPTKGDHENINKVITELMKQCRVSPMDNPFSYLWTANCVLYSVVTAFLLYKGWKKQGSGKSSNQKSKRSKCQKAYEEKAECLRKKISMAKSEIERLKENRKMTKRGKRNRAILQQECKELSIASLVSYMERQKCALRKLKRAFGRNKKNKEAKVLNQQFKEDAGRVYANMREMLAKCEDCDRPKYEGANGNTAAEEREKFGSIEEASSFWRELWEGEGTGNSQAEWLNEVRDAIFSKVPPPAEEAWTLETVEAVGILKRKKNWSAPGPDKLVNYWWKRAQVLHEGMARSFEAISRSDDDYPSWFAEGKTSLIPKPGEFTSDNQRPITCLNTAYKWFTSCVLGPMDQHLEEHGLMEGSQRGAKKGCSGTVDNLLIDRVVTLDCQRRRRNLSMAWVDVKKAYDSVDHGWLGEMMVLHRFPKWMCKVISKLCKSWKTRIIANTRHGWEVSDPIMFKKGLPQGDALCPRLFTICLNPVAWKISASEGYKLSKPISATVTDLLYIDDLKVFAANETKLNRVLESTQVAMEDIGLQWNPRKCAVVHIRRGIHSQENLGGDIAGGRLPSLEEGKQYKFLGVLESLVQEEKMVLECAAREYLRRLSIIWSSPLSDFNRVAASNQFALPVLGYLMWTQHWPITELKILDREVRKIIVENGGKHPGGSTALLYLPRGQGGRGLRAVEMEYKVTKVKAAIRMYENQDPAMRMVREFDERAESSGHKSIVKDAAKFAAELGVDLHLKHPEPVCVMTSGEAIPPQRVKGVLKECVEEKYERDVRGLEWQGKLLRERKDDEQLCTNGCFSWLRTWRSCPTYTIAGAFELYEQLLPTKLYTSKKTHTSCSGDVKCRICGHAQESVSHILSGCTALAQTKYLFRHNMALKVLFYEILHDQGLLEEVPPWYSPVMPKPEYRSEQVEAWWDVPVYADHQEVRANRVDARIVDHANKKVLTLEMSCPWISNREKKSEEKTMKYGPLRWELKQQYRGYEVIQHNIIMDVLGGWSRETETSIQSLVGRKANQVLEAMQKAVLSSSLNIARTFKVMI